MLTSRIFLLSLASFGLMTSVYAGHNHTRLHKTHIKQAPQITVSQSQPIHLNTADAGALTNRVKGIGASRAKAIVAYRDAHGPFTSLDELVKVKGISANTLQKYSELWHKMLIVDKPFSR